MDERWLISKNMLRTVTPFGLLDFMFLSAEQFIRQNPFLPITGILVLGRKMCPTPNPEYGMFLAGEGEKGKILLGLY